MIHLLGNSVHVNHLGQSGGRGLSPRVWGKLVGQAASPDGDNNLYGAFDDFINIGPSLAVAANVGYYASEGGLYKSYEDTGGTIAQSATIMGGAVVLTTDADTDDENWITGGAGTGAYCQISDTAGSDKPLAFEARWKTSAVVGNAFVGLSEPARAVADQITDAGAMVDKDFIGFVLLEGAPTTLKFVYRKEGGAMQTVLSYGTAIAADTWVKTGFFYDPTAEPSKRIKIYVDNVEQSTYVTATNIAASTFPDAQPLVFLAGHKNVTDITALTLDWYAVAQRS
jgi:hypothetical protein